MKKNTPRSWTKGGKGLLGKPIDACVSGCFARVDVNLRHKRRDSKNSFHDVQPNIHLCL